jgi:uncharacterized protein
VFAVSRFAAAAQKIRFLTAACLFAVILAWPFSCEIGRILRRGRIDVSQTNPRGIMKKLFATALVIGFVTSAALARSQEGPPPAATSAASPDSTPPAIPPDQQPTKEQVAKLFEVMHLREQTASMMKTLPAMLQQQVREQEKAMMANLPDSARLTPELQASLDGVTDRYMEKVINLYPVDEMLDDMAAIYQRHFTREDVDAYTAFYTTPAGQHLLRLTPIIMQEYMPVVMQRMQERSKDLMAAMMKEMIDVVKSSAPAAPAPPAPAPK